MLQITEDTPPDMLAGAMDLTVHLPNGRAVKMSVERSTPMMDLLVQITTLHQLQLSNYTLQALAMTPSAEYKDKILPFKPNTPIGALDTQHVRVLPKSRSIPVPKNIPLGHQPFESTFRLKVHLPRNQLYVTRVSRTVLLEDIMKKVCEEKNLDPMKYEFKHAGNLDEALDPKLTLSDYQITEIYVVQKGSTNLNQALSSTDIMSLRKEEERKQMHNKTGGGVFNLIFRRGKSSMGSGSVSSDNRSISPVQSDESRSVTPPGVPEKIHTTPVKKEPPPDRPKPPQRKRRPAPRPPQGDAVDEKPPSTISISEEAHEPANKPEANGLTICHSRNSSDSSGYHEASILSDHNGNASLPRRPKSAFIGNDQASKMMMLGEHSQSTTNLSKVQSKSTTSLISGRKKKAAPPPPPVVVSTANSESTLLEKPSPLVASQPDIPTKESTHSTQLGQSNTLNSLEFMSLPVAATQNRSTTTSSTLRPQDSTLLGSTDSGIAQDTTNTSTKVDEPEPEVRELSPIPPPILDDLPDFQENSSLQETQQNLESLINTPKQSENLSLHETQISSSTGKINIQEDKSPLRTEHKDKSEEISEIDWQYELPSPPKAFRDETPSTLTLNNDSSSLSNFQADSVVTSPELFEKLKVLEDVQSVQSSKASTQSEDEKPLNSLTLENLEKRKSLVYNRELSTSLKMTDHIIDVNTHSGIETFSSSLTKFQSTYDDLNHQGRKTETPVQPTVKYVTNTLPNFKITTYDVPKQKIKVFEDDTVRSNTNYLRRDSNSEVRRKNSSEEVTHQKSSTEYKFYKPHKVGDSVARSGSFSSQVNNGWSPSKPVSRSKSQLTLNKYRDEKARRGSEDTVLSKSSSLFDVSGLQSLGVMKQIQNKLSTPTVSMENLHHPTQEKPTSYNISTNTNTKIEIKQPTSTQVTSQKYLYHYEPPAINMSTWSERPKQPVAVKEDQDYKLGNHTPINTIKSVNTGTDQTDSVSIRVNGSTTAYSTNSTPNVVIKLQSDPRSTLYAPVGYRKPFSSVNTSTTRPHSVAFGSDFDISRVPVVRSVEFKKPFKDIQNNNTSVTHIYQSDDNNTKVTKDNSYFSQNGSNKFSNTYKSSETLSINNKISTDNTVTSNSVLRINSFKIGNNAPVVTGFRKPNDITSSHRYSWNPQKIINTQDQSTKEYTTNQNVPFSQSNLRRTESTSRKVVTATNITNNNSVEQTKNVKNSEFISMPTISNSNSDNSRCAPAARPMPKIALRKSASIKTTHGTLDARDALLDSIRNFGGKKGLKAGKMI